MARSRSRALTKIWPIADRPNGCVVGVTLTPQVLGIGGYSNHQVRRQLIVQLQDAKPQAQSTAARCKPQAVPSQTLRGNGPIGVDWIAYCTRARLTFFPWVTSRSSKRGNTHGSLRCSPKTRSLGFPNRSEKPSPISGDGPRTVSR